jgi:hypothetical protein
MTNIFLYTSDYFLAGASGFDSRNRYFRENSTYPTLAISSGRTIRVNTQLSFIGGGQYSLKFRFSMGAAADDVDLLVGSTGGVPNPVYPVIVRGTI